MSGFFDQLERQLIELASAERDADGAEARHGMGVRRGMGAGVAPRRLPSRAWSLRALPVAAVALLAAGIVIASLPRPRGARTEGIAQAPLGGLRAGRQGRHHLPLWAQKPATLVLHAMREIGGGAVGASNRISGRGALTSPRPGGRLSDIAWEGSSCSGCYLISEAAVRSKAPATRRQWAIGINVGGGDLKRICVWALSGSGQAEEGSTCSTESMLSIGRLPPRGRTTVLTEGVAAGGRQIKLAGGI